MKHLLLTLLLMFSTTAHSFSIVDYKNAKGFKPFGVSQKCRDPDKTLVDKTDSTVFICGVFSAGKYTYMAFAEKDDLEVLELYQYKTPKSLSWCRSTHRSMAMRSSL